MKKKPSIFSAQENIFAEANKEQNLKNAPLSFRMRPQILEEYVGQKHILGEG